MNEEALKEIRELADPRGIEVTVTQDGEYATHNTKTGSRQTFPDIEPLCIYLICQPRLEATGKD